MNWPKNCTCVNYNNDKCISYKDCFLLDDEIWKEHCSEWKNYNFDNFVLNNYNWNPNCKQKEKDNHRCKTCNERYC